MKHGNSSCVNQDICQHLTPVVVRRGKGERDRQQDQQEELAW